MDGMWGGRNREMFNWQINHTASTTMIDWWTIKMPSWALQDLNELPVTLISDIYVSLCWVCFKSSYEERHKIPSIELLVEHQHMLICKSHAWSSKTQQSDLTRYFSRLTLLLQSSASHWDSNVNLQHPFVTHPRKLNLPSPTHHHIFTTPSSISSSNVSLRHCPSSSSPQTI